MLPSGKDQAMLTGKLPSSEAAASIAIKLGKVMVIFALADFVLAGFWVTAAQQVS